MTSHKKMITNLKSFSFGFCTNHNILSFFEQYISFLRLMLEIFYISTLRVSLWLFKHHTFQLKMSVSLFPSQILVCMTAFAAHNLLFHFEIYIWWALTQKHKNKGGKIYRHKSMQVSRPSRPLTNQSFMTSLNIYLRQSHIVFKISPTKIYVHT